MEEIEVGKVYRHFKNKLYLVESVAYDCESLKEKVIYRALYGEYKLWVRDKEEFLCEIKDREDNMTGQKYRFERYDI